MLVAVASDGTGGGWLRPLDRSAAPERVSDLAAAVARREATDRPRWLWASTAATYQRLRAAGVRVARCHDLELTEALLLGHAGHWGQPRSVAAILARRAGGPVPPDPLPPATRPPGGSQDSLFDAAPAVTEDPTADLHAAYADQQRRMEPGRFRLLVAAESAGALVAVEMGHDGLPWRADVHDAVLAELLGPRSPVGGLPRRLAELATAIAEALDAPGLHPDSPAELRRAFARAGIDLPDTRAWSLRRVDHPAVPLVLEFKERYRIWTAHGWAWREAWVRDGRFRPEYVPGGVVSGRWATRGGGALQIPKAVRRAVVADPGWKLVVADAGQLEPRILAAVSGDPRLAAAAAAGDLYAALAAESFHGNRAAAKVALLGAMYGQSGGAALPAIAVLRQRYPIAWDYVEHAARTGEAGGLVRSWLGRTCPTGRGDRARGRFTRNFVIQATAAEWAISMLAMLRADLAGKPAASLPSTTLANRSDGTALDRPDAGRPASPAPFDRADAAFAAQLVLFQHDEVLVHCPASEVDIVTDAVRRAGVQAGRLLFGDTPVRFPLDISVVDCYSDAS